MPGKARNNSHSGSRRASARIPRQFWQTARRAARQVPFMEDLVAAYYCALDKPTPLRAKGIMLAASPISCCLPTPSPISSSGSVLPTTSPF